MVASPAKRRESTPLLEKIKTDVSMTKLKLSSAWKKEDKVREILEDTPLLSYLRSQVRSTTSIKVYLTVGIACFILFFWTTEVVKNSASFIDFWRDGGNCNPLLCECLWDKYNLTTLTTLCECLWDYYNQITCPLAGNVT